MEELSIAIRNTTGRVTPRPVTGGVPIAQGAAPRGSAFALHDADGSAVPVQTSVIARWQDGSARWVLLDFQSRPPAGGESRYVLTWGDRAGAADGPAPECDVLQSDSAGLVIVDRFDVRLTLADGEGLVCGPVVERTDMDTPGPLRTTLLQVGSFRTPSGERVFQFRMRASVYAGLSMIRLEPMVIVDPDEGITQRIRELKLSLAPRDVSQSARIGGNPGWQGAVSSPVRLFQYDDQHYRFDGVELTGGQAPGWAEAEDEQGAVAVALRDFWQQWPKSLEVSTAGLSVGLFPKFGEGDLEHLEPWYKHQYLFDGECYQLRTGQARRWDLWLGLNGDGESLAKAANAPLVPSVAPTQAIATGVWDEIAPAATAEMKEYDPWAENLFDAYCHSIEAQRDYGAMNWGDWFGERTVNWGNHEYDTTNQILIQFARTGDPKYFYTADGAARHSSEVDTIHHVNEDLAKYFIDNFGNPGYPPRAGMVHEHSVGHVGSFYPPEEIRKLFVAHGVGNSDNPYLCLDPYNLGHIWTQGLVRQYFLTGDAFFKETVESIGANLAQLVEDGEYKFIGHSHCGRTAGWSLLALAGAYELDFDERHLYAMKTIVDAALDEQDPHCGGWLYSLPRGHCYCEKAKHVGMAGFITAVLVNGLSRYYLLTGDERLPEAIDKAITFLNNDTWVESLRDWRYTSCPASNPTNRPGVVVMAHVNAVRIANDPEHLRILRLAWEVKFKALLEAPEPGPGQGKAFSSKMYGCAEAVGLLASR